MKRRAIIVALALSLIPLITALANRPTPENFDVLRLSLGQAPDFVAEYHNLVEDMTDAGYWKTRDYSGRYYNFKNGGRYVVGQSGEFEHSLWIFGNSGFQDPWVSDRESAAAKLAALVGRTYRVVNYSAGGQRIQGQLAWLRETPVQAGDIVVFIDGAFGDDLGAINQAQDYTLRHGATWWHFRQPSSQPIGGSGLPINLSVDNFVEGVHLNALGAKHEAEQMYFWMVIY